jgi:hypothetical protein
MKMTIDDVELWAKRNNFTIVADEWWEDAQDIICKYRKIEQIVDRYEAYRRGSVDKGPGGMMKEIIEIVKGKKE